MKTLLTIICVLSNALSAELPLNFVTKEFVAKAFSQSQEILQESISKESECFSHMRLFLENAYQMKLWALQMIDANGKIQPGLLRGNFYQAGNYDQCLAIQEGDLSGQYCSAFIFGGDRNATTEAHLLRTNIGLPNNVSTEDLNYFRAVFGVCLPKSCSPSDLQAIWDQIENTFDLGFKLKFSDTMCDYKGKPVQPFEADFYVYCFFTLLIIFLLLSTIYEKVVDPQRQNKFLTIFSVSKNFNDLLKTAYGSNQEQCLHGIRVLSMLWIMFTHRAVFDLFFPNVNLLDMWKTAKTSYYHAYTYVPAFFTDTFLALTGFLTFSSYISVSERGKVTLLNFYLKRIVRLMPLLMGAILIYISVIKRLGDGPAWQLISKRLSLTCYENWWTSLLPIANIVDTQTQCMEQAWYVSLDLQLYIISPIFLFNLNKHPKKTIFGMLLLGLLSMIYTFYVVVINKFPVLSIEGDPKFFLYYYYSPFTRVLPWLVGALGFLFVKQQRSLVEKKQNKSYGRLVLYCSLLTLFVLSFSTTFVTIAKNEYLAAIHTTIVRVLWCSAIVGVIYSCMTYKESYVNEFLSLPIFAILSKLTYGWFLLHIGIIYLFIGRQRLPAYRSMPIIGFKFLGDIYVNIVCSGMFYLVFDAPVKELFKLLSLKESRKSCENLSEKAHKQ